MCAPPPNQGMIASLTDQALLLRIKSLFSPPVIPLLPQQIIRHTNRQPSLTTAAPPIPHPKQPPPLNNPNNPRPHLHLHMPYDQRPLEGQGCRLLTRSRRPGRQLAHHSGVAGRAGQGQRERGEVGEGELRGENFLSSPLRKTGRSFVEIKHVPSPQKQLAI